LRVRKVYEDLSLLGHNSIERQLDLNGTCRVEATAQNDLRNAVRKILGRNLHASPVRVAAVGRPVISLFALGWNAESIPIQNVSDPFISLS
jgi:hypothetical protein